MDNLRKYLCSIDAETVWMYFYAHGCEVCPARTYCDAQPEGTCCRENFMAWANGGTSDERDV